MISHNTESTGTNVFNGSVYMSKIDAHAPGTLHVTDCTKIRPVLFMYSLFIKELCISDSTINNNPELRKLIHPQISGNLIDKGINADFLKLLREGFLKPVVRNGFTGFVNLRNTQALAKKAPPNLPDIEYCEFLDKNNIKTIPYYLDKVSNLFKDKLTHRLEACLEEKPLSLEYYQTVEALYANVQQNEVPLFAVLLDMIDRRLKDHVLTKEEFQKLKDLIALSYVFNVPDSLDMSFCLESDRIPSVRQTEYETVGQDHEILEEKTDFSLCFSLQNLQNLSTDVLSEIKNSKEFFKVSHAICGNINSVTEAKAFFTDFNAYKEKLESIYKRELPSMQFETTYKEAKDKKITLRWKRDKHNRYLWINTINDGESEELLKILRPFRINSKCFLPIASAAMNSDFIAKPGIL
jgi:hypothetical protein